MTITADPDGYSPDVVEYGSALLPQHAALLAASAISSDVAHQRGYRSVTKAVELERCGFGKAQRQVPALLIPVYDVRGEIALYQARPDYPRRSRSGKAVKYETPTGAAMTLDVPPAVRERLKDPACPLFITEGVRKADAAASIGLACIALLGVWNWRGTNDKGGKLALADFDEIALNDGRAVYLAFDSDVVLKSEVHAALERLKALLERRGADVRVINLPSGEGGTKVGLDDFLAAGNDVDDLLALASLELRPSPDAGDERRAPSPAALLVELAKEAGAELFHTPDGKAYATVPVDGHRETWPLKPRSGFEHWLRRTFRERTRDAVNAQAVDDALRELEAYATFEGPEQQVAVRIAARDDAIYLDLVNEGWEAVEITANGWRLIAEPPVKFRRRAAMLALPHPVAGGTVDELRPFLNVASEEDWMLLVGWLLGAFSPRGPYPVLALHGEQGSAKSTTARLLRSLVDPSASPLRGEPRGAHDLMIAASNAWCLAFDNLSHVQPWLSDALCRLANGGGFSTRALYTDDDEIVFEAQRPLLLTGIEEVVTRSDLLSRAILLELAPIAGERMQDEASLQAAFAAAQPRILGAFLDAVSGAISRRPHVKLERLPRMADFALWVTAAEEALGWAHASFVSAYDDNREAANDIAIEASTIAQAVRELAAAGEFTGSATELLAELAERAGETVTRRRGWPGSARALSGELRRLAPNLRSAGLSVEFGWEGRGGSRRRVVSIGTAQLCVPTVPIVPAGTETAISSGLSAPVAGTLGGDANGGGNANGDANGSGAMPLTERFGDDGDGGDARTPARSSARAGAQPAASDELAEIERPAARHADLADRP